MKNGKLGALLSTFNAAERASFLDFAASPYFNRNEDLTRMARFLVQIKPEKWIKREIWAHVFPDLGFDEKQFNYLSSWLYQLALQFIGVEQSRSKPESLAMSAAESLSARGLEGHYQFEIERVRKRAARTDFRDDSYYLSAFQLEYLERSHYARLAERRSNPRLQSGADALDRFYFSTKLKYACAMLNDQAILTANFELTFTDELAYFLQSNPRWLEEPAIAIYYRIWRMLTRHENETDFAVLKDLIDRHIALFTSPEQAELYSYALNFCIKKIRNVQEEYVAEALHLYEKAIDGRVLLTDGALMPWHFKNIVKLGLRSQRFDWTERFIREKSALLEPDFRPDALHFSLADLFFYTHQYDKALSHLHRIAFTDIHYDLGAREMLAKIYFLTQADEALFSLLHAFRTFLRRNKVVGQDVRKAYANFIVLLEKLMRAKRYEWPALRQKITQTEPLVAKNWLLEQIP